MILLKSNSFDTQSPRISFSYKVKDPLLFFSGVFLVRLFCLFVCLKNKQKVIKNYIEYLVSQLHILPVTKQEAMSKNSGCINDDLTRLQSVAKLLRAAS